MIYKLSLNEDVYSKEHIDELVACIRSSISGYVDLLGPLNKDNSFDITWDSDLNQKVAIKITDEHDKYGLSPLEFNLYIDGEEFGPMCYSSIEIATMETKDFILSKLHKKFVEPRSPKLEEATITSEDSVPYTHTQIFDELKLETQNWTLDSDTIRYKHKSEVDSAVKILRKHYINVTDPVETPDSWYQIEFSGKKSKNKRSGIKEATLADYTVGDPDNQRYIGNAQIIKVSDLPRIGEKFKAGIATAINKIGYEEGYMIYEVWVTEPGSLEGFAEFEYDTARWLFAIKNFNEALERSPEGEEDLNEFAYKVDDLKQFYNTSTSIDKEKYPNFFAWYDAMTKEGKFKNSQITA